MKTLSFNLEDAAQVCVGAFALAVPVAFSEEAWRLGETLPIANVLLLVTLSFSFLAVFAYGSLFQGKVSHRIPTFIFRIVIAYLITTLVVALILLCIDKLPLLSTPIISLRRVIVITMPASMGAIIVDSFDKE
jgi:uncharacterized membrane protein